MRLAAVDAPARPSGLAVLSALAGVGSLLVARADGWLGPMLALAAIALAVATRRELRRIPSRSGARLAVAGILLGGVGVLLTLPAVVIGSIAAWG